MLDDAIGDLTLAAIKPFVSDNNAVIMTIVLRLLGAKLLGDGLADLWR